MARLDGLRRRVEISPADLDVVRRSTQDELLAADRPRLQRLVDAGLFVADGRPHPLLLDLAYVMSHPMIEATIETTSPHGATFSVLTINDEDLWYQDPWPGNDPLSDEMVFQRDELPQLLWIFRSLTGLHRREIPEVARPLELPLAAIGDVLLLMGSEGRGGSGWDDVRSAVIAGMDERFPELSTEDRLLTIGLLGSLQATWRLTVAWGNDALERGNVRGLAVWDCGAAGYWVRTTPAEPLTAEQITADTVARFEPRTAGQLWAAFADLLPSGAELADGLAERNG